MLCLSKQSESLARPNSELAAPCKERTRGHSLFANFRHARIHHPPRGTQVACIPLKHHSKDPIYPSLRANPFLKVTDLFCRLPLPTLLYGPEAARLGDLLRLWVRAGVRLSLCFSFFKDSGEYAGRLGRQGALPAS